MSKLRFKHANRADGFTILELLISLSIAFVLIMAVMTQNRTLIQQQMFYVTRSNLVQDTLLVGDFFSKQIQAIGGGAVRPWQAIWVENNCGPRGPLPGCAGSDRITLTTATSPLTECLIDTNPGPNLLHSSVLPCCLTAQFLNRQLMLTQDSTDWAQIYATAVNPVACTLSFAKGQSSGNDAPQPAPVSWNDSTLTIVDVATYYLSPSPVNQILQFTDKNGNGLIDNGEQIILADQAFDLQAALGYDLDGTNNLKDLGTITDSYLYNATGESWGAGVFAPPITLDLLRMVTVGVELGTRANYVTIQTPGTSQLLDHPQITVPGFDLRSTIVKVTPRNSFIFE